MLQIGVLFFILYTLRNLKICIQREPCYIKIIQDFCQKGALE